MASSVLEQYRIADFIEWDSQKRLILAPDFQRGPVWTSAANSFLIDTILRELPIPKIYMRTKIDLLTRASVREIVDGQQRLRAILKFASDGFVLDKRTNEYSGYTYSKLDDELKQRFLSYTIAVDQLINATDEQVLEVFLRLNSYTVSLTPPELRNARYQGNFKWVVRDALKKWSLFWDRFHIQSIRDRVRMADHSLMAEMVGILLEGVSDGGQRRIEKLYKKYDAEVTNQEEILNKLDETLSFMRDNFAEVLVEPVSRAPHFLMFFAAVANALVGIPDGELGSNMPKKDKRVLENLQIAKDNIITLSGIIELTDPPLNSKFLDFWKASSSTTQSLTSRRVRFPIYYKALLPEPI